MVVTTLFPTFIQGLEVRSEQWDGDSQSPSEFIPDVLESQGESPGVGQKTAPWM